MQSEWIVIIFSGLSLVISIVVAWNSAWKSRASLKIDNLKEGLFLKSFDGCIKSYSFEDYYYSPNFYSVILIDLIITNKSSNPISILEFSIPEFPIFNSYSTTQDAFFITTKENFKIHIGGNIPIKYLKPEFTIAPYTSVRGHVLFWSGYECVIDRDKDIPLTIKTSRKTFKKDIQIKSVYSSIKKHVHLSTDEKGNIVETFRG